MKDSPQSYDAFAAYPALQVIRALVPIGVLIGHWGTEQGVDFFPQGQLIIDFMFIVEGFLAAAAFSGAKGTALGAHPIRDRILHVYPLFILAQATGLAVFMPLILAKTDHWTLAFAASAFASGAALQPTFSDVAHGAVFPYNWPVWAIVGELWAFIFLCRFRSNLSLRTLIYVCGATTFIMLATAIFWHDSNLGWKTGGYWGGAARVAYGFTIGALIYHLNERFRPRFPRVNPIIPWAGAVAILMVDFRFASLLLLITAAPLLVWLAAISKTPNWLIEPCRQAGKHALSLYLTHFPVLMAFLMIQRALAVPPELMLSPISFTLLMAIIALVAYSATRFFDEPIRGALLQVFREPAPARAGDGRLSQ